MKIVLSPSKTKTITNVTSNDGAVHTAVLDGQFQPHITQKIVKHVQSLDVAALSKALKLRMIRHRRSLISIKILRPILLGLLVKATMVLLSNIWIGATYLMRLRPLVKAILL